MMRLGITQRVVVTPNTKERRDALAQDWYSFLESVGVTLVPVPNFPKQTETWVKSLALEGFILSGGNDLCGLNGATDIAPERDETETRIIDLAFQNQLPVLGVCRGMQMLLHHTGETIEAVTHHADGPHALASSQLPGFSVGTKVNSFHRYGCRQIRNPKAWQILAQTADGSIEAVRHLSHRALAIMWHPERGIKTQSNVELFRTFFLGK